MQFQKAFIALSLLILVAGVSVAGPADDLLAAALKSIRDGDFQEALQILGQMKQVSPDDARAYFYSGVTLYRTDQQRQGLAELKRAVELAPDEPQFLLVYSELLLQTGYHFEALELLEPAAERFSPKDLSAEQEWYFSDLLFRLGKPEKSLRFLVTYTAERPEDERVYFRKAQIHLIMNDLEKALRSFEEAYEKTLRKPAARYGTGLVEFQRGELEASLVALQEAVEGEPDNPEYVHLLSQVLFSLGKGDAALEHLKRVEPQGDQYPKIYDALARVYRQRGDRELADQYTRKFRALDTEERREAETGERVHTILRDAQRLFNERRLDEARNRFEEVLESEPDNFMAHSYLVEINLSLRAWNRASFHLDRLQGIDSEAFESNYLMAAFLYRRGSPGEALAYAEKAKALQPSLADLRNLLGNIHWALENWNEAKEEYAAAVALEPDRTEFKLNLETADRKLRPN